MLDLAVSIKIGVLPPFLAEFSHHIEPGHPRQSPIQHNQVILINAQHVQGGFAIVFVFDRIMLTRQRELDLRSEISFVFLPEVLCSLFSRTSVKILIGRAQVHTIIASPAAGN